MAKFAYWTQTITSLFFKHQLIINVSAQKKPQYLPASLNTLWVIIILTNRLSLLLLFVSKLISISVEIPLGTFLNLVSDISEKKIRKLVQRERLTLPNKLFIVGYDATEFKTSSKMAAIWQPPFWNPFQDKKIGFILAAIVSEFNLKRPNDSEDFQKYFIDLT